MTPGDWAEVFRAGWNAEGLHASDFTGNAMASVLVAMEEALWNIHENAYGTKERNKRQRIAEENIDG